MMGLLKHKLAGGSEMFKLSDTGNKINSKWTNEELLLAVQGIIFLIS